jgi:hypothetical protein
MIMNMIDLKRSKPKNAKTTEREEVVTRAYNERPYSLRFTLEKPELDKLGLTTSSFVGMEPFQATVMLDPINVRDITSKNDYDENNNQSVEVQVMSISIGDMITKKTRKFGVYNAMRKKGPGEE